MFGVVKLQIDGTAVLGRQWRAQLKASTEVSGHHLVRCGDVNAEKGQVEELMVCKAA